MNLSSHLDFPVQIRMALFSSGNSLVLVVAQQCAQIPQLWSWGRVLVRSGLCCSQPSALGTWPAASAAQVSRQPGQRL